MTNEEFFTAFNTFYNQVPFSVQFYKSNKSYTGNGIVKCFANGAKDEINCVIERFETEPVGQKSYDSGLIFTNIVPEVMPAKIELSNLATLPFSYLPYLNDSNWKKSINSMISSAISKALTEAMYTYDFIDVKNGRQKIMRGAHFTVTI
jgi:hypothetical protein